MSLQRAETDPEKRPDDGLDLFVLSYIFKYWSSYFLEVELPCQRVWTFFFFFFLKAFDAYCQTFFQNARSSCLSAGGRSGTCRPGWEPEPGGLAPVAEGREVNSPLAFEEQRVWFRVTRQGFGAGAGSSWCLTLDGFEGFETLSSRRDPLKMQI